MKKSLELSVQGHGYSDWVDPDAASVCAECGRSSGGRPRFYRQYRKPQVLADVYFCPRAGQHIPIVSGRLAQELNQRLGGHPTVDLWVGGWHPDHDLDAQVPPL